MSAKQRDVREGGFLTEGADYSRVITRLLLGKTALGLILLLGVFCSIYAYVASANIHGDGLGRYTEATEIAATGDLLENRPYLIMRLEDGSIDFYPNKYQAVPQISMASFALLADGSLGEAVIKLYSPILGALTALFVYLLVCQAFHRSVAFGAAVLTILFNMPRLIMVPLIEQLLLMESAAALYFYVSWLRTKSSGHLLLAGIFLGLAVGTKQQGWILAAGLAAHAGVLLAWDFIRERRSTRIRPLVALALVVIVISAVPLLHQIEKNGTVLNVPTNQALLFLESKYPQDSDALQILRSRQGYLREVKSVPEVFERVFLYPVYYDRAFSFIRNFSPQTGILLASVAALFGLGAYEMLRRNGRMALVLLTLFIIWSLEIYVYGPSSNLQQYHNVLLLVLAAFIAAGSSIALRALARARFGKLLATSLAVVIVVVIGNAFVTYVHEPLYGESGRSTGFYQEGWAAMCQYVDEEIADDVVFLASSQDFRHLCRRNTFWITEGGGKNVPLIFSSPDVDESVHELRQYGIEYVVIDAGQTTRRGVFDYIPQDRFFRNIKSSPQFELLFEYEDTLLLYRLTGKHSEPPNPYEVRPAGY